MKQILYQPPEGYYDLPFTWAYDASGLTVGKNYPNQFIYLLGGYGEFICRRMVGMSNLLDFTAGQFQVKDRNSNYIESDKVFAARAYDELFPSEIRYPELGAIRFDLYNFNPVFGQAGAQLAFQGSRRLKGQAPGPAYKFKPKSFTYIVSGVLTGLWPDAAPITVSQVVNDYDFELLNVILLQGGSATLQLRESAALWTAVQPGPAGDLITIQVTGAGTPNSVLGITVVGNAITINLGTDAGGTPTSTNQQVLNLWNTTPAAEALATLQIIPASALPLVWDTGNFGPDNLGGGLIQPITTPTVQLWLYDQNRVQTSNMPINDFFVDGGPGSFYANGALVPRLFYRQQSRIQIDLYSLITNPSALPQTITIMLVGRQLFPC